MPFYFDLHVHTSKGSGDSALTPEELVAQARRIGLDGVCLAEHDSWMERDEFERFARGSGIVVVRAQEVTTPQGHVLVFGVDEYQPGRPDLGDLRRAVQRAGGLMVLAHPFRRMFNPPPDNQNILYGGRPEAYPKTPAEAAKHPAFEMVDEIEGLNGGNTEQENEFALAVVRRLGLKGTGGSDAHAAEQLGRRVTAFQEPVRSAGEFLEALRAKAFAPSVLPGLAKWPVQP
ncbi:MAG: hypothetical protein EXR48_05350 [Dehalococcoidia bacterium]|nr:hypothetical protein [Dehalococcoidia bacterium]